MLVHSRNPHNLPCHAILLCMGLFTPSPRSSMPSCCTGDAGGSRGHVLYIYLISVCQWFGTSSSSSWQRLRASLSSPYQWLEASPSSPSVTCCSICIFLFLKKRRKLLWVQQTTINQAHQYTTRLYYVRHAILYGESASSASSAASVSAA
jgi:hypothetical protein